MKKNNISTKIKLLGTLFIILMTSVIATTIYLNNKNDKDALVVNIAGKQRMLTQNISKNIFYINQHPSTSFLELDSSVDEFIYNLNSLKDGNTLPNIKEAPTSQIANQLMKIEILWGSFYKNINLFKTLLTDKEQQNELKATVNTIYNSNTILLNEVDILVSMYTTFSEEKTKTIKYAQYIFAFLILLLVIYSFKELKSMERNALNFLKESKKLMEQDFEQPLEPIKIDAEGEIIEATNTINNFIKKINSAMDDSTNAMIQSKNASSKLEELTSEFDDIIDDLKNSSVISKHLNRSEDIVIQSQEYLIHSTKRLEELKKELESIMLNCETTNKN